MYTEEQVNFVENLYKTGSGWEKISELFRKKYPELYENRCPDLKSLMKRHRPNVYAKDPLLSTKISTNTKRLNKLKRFFEDLRPDIAIDYNSDQAKLFSDGLVSMNIFLDRCTQNYQFTSNVPERLNSIISSFNKRINEQEILLDRSKQIIETMFVCLVEINNDISNKCISEICLLSSDLEEM
jgi:hypothetical protein